MPAVGDRFGRWTVAAPPVRRGGVLVCPVSCDCGATGMTSTTDLRRGHSKSCGCLSADVTRARSAIPGMMRPDGRRLSPEAVAWRGAKARCRNPGDSRFNSYGGRGIAVCERWLGRQGFAHFLADMGPRPSPGHSLDRIDVNGNYEPGNCRWATKEQQDNNKRATVMVEYDGRMMPAAAWSKELGIKLKTITARVRRGFRGARALAPVLAAAARGGK